MKKLFAMMVTVTTCAMFSFAAFAQDAVVIAPTDYLTSIVQFVQTYGGLSTFAKIAGVITLLLSSMKVSFFNELIWNKLGKFKAWAAPVLALISGMLYQMVDGSQITLASIMVYLGTGVGAIAFHELLDTVKALPGIGPTWVSIIDLMKTIFGGPKTQAKGLYR